MGEAATKAPETGSQRYPPFPGRSGAILRASVRQQGAHLVDDRSYGLLIVVLSALLLVSVLVGISIGAVSLPLSDVWGSIVRHLTGGVAAMDDVNDRIIWEFRTPRVLLAGVVGAGLAVAGTVLQALVRNPLADPFVLGVSSGASLAAVAVILLGSAALLGLGV